MIRFEKREITENEWKPNVCGVDFSLIMAQKLGEAAMNGVDIYTIWGIVGDDDTGEGYEMQITPENCRLFISDLDDESDMIAILDRRDGNWWNIFRVTVGDEVFNNVLQGLAFWGHRVSSLTPMPEVYQRYLEIVARDISDDFEIPSDW